MKTKLLLSLYAAGALVALAPGWGVYVGGLLCASAVTMSIRWGA